MLSSKGKFVMALLAGWLILTLILVPALYVPLPEKQSPLVYMEKTRYQDIHRMLSVIEDNENLRAEMQKLINSGYSPNEAVATIIATKSLWRKLAATAPLLIKTEDDRWLLLSTHGNAYEFVEEGNHYKLVKDTKKENK